MEIIKKNNGYEIYGECLTIELFGFIPYARMGLVGKIIYSEISKDYILKVSFGVRLDANVLSQILGFMQELNKEI
jgi:hypothetical protein